jgi:pimeloyl-ACP methyl ester carboxylesterase
VLRPPGNGFASLDEAAAELARIRGQEARAGGGERLRRHMREDAGGRWHCHWDPAWMDREQGIGLAMTTEFLEAQARKLTMPVLLTRGELSKVVGEEGLSAFRALVPHLAVETIAGAGHMIVGDRNDAFADAVIAFLDRKQALRPGQRLNRVCDRLARSLAMEPASPESGA